MPLCDDCVEPDDKAGANHIIVSKREYDDSFGDVCEICGATAEEEAEAKAGYLKGASSGMVRLAFVRQASPCSTVSHSFVLQCSWKDLLSVGGSRIAESNRKRCGVPNRIS
ncbi:hypothetical protein CCL21_06535 [Pseudomonas syringae]|nr:hypothetical protein CCL21_06535 [Pseudomonas syringae]